MIDLQPILQAPLTAVWQKEANLPFAHERGYAHPKALQEGSVLFIGLATSYNQTHNVDGDPTKPLVFDLYDNPGNFYRKEMDFLATVDPALPYAHLDVLFQRESEQKAIQAMLGGAGAGFASDQLAVTRDVLTHLTQLPARQRPRAIVVANRLAQELLGFFYNPIHPDERQWLGLTFTEQLIEPHEELYYLCNEWGNIPVIFTTPFSGMTARFNTPEKKAAKHSRLAAILERLIG